ncbi:hypothetical protein MTR67_003958 [Solanum verrucosum]|uniref:Uncharacterized protein n=1 Tax=Solanum verrucosum TaxID=315347 RepID=A0AAF0PT66_SOLVR|nr:hypothetical protein MTR67_003958 [Solanum verrucosum]
MDTPRCALDKENPLSRIGEGQISVGSSLTSGSPIQALLGKPAGMNITTTATNKILWKQSKDGVVSVNNAYNRGLDYRGWQGPQNIILVIDKKSMSNTRSSKEERQLVSGCFECNLTVETNNHHFLHWNLFLNITSMNWTMQEHTSDLLSCWIRRGGSKSQKRLWKLILSCVWWNFSDSLLIGYFTSLYGVCTLEKQVVEVFWLSRIILVEEAL